MTKNSPASKIETRQLADLGAAILRQLPRVPGLGEVARGWIENPMALRKVLGESLSPEGRKSFTSELLLPVGTVNVAGDGRFVAGAHFFIANKAVKIAWIGDNFRQWFLAKVEELQAEATLRYSRLKKSSPDAPILAELGNQAETTLANIWELLEKQPNGESGALLSNDCANIFYVRDVNGVLLAVDVSWFGGGWDIDADSFGDPDRWSGGSRVFSRHRIKV